MARPHSDTLGGAQRINKDCPLSNNVSFKCMWDLKKLVSQFIQIKQVLFEKYRKKIKY